MWATIITMIKEAWHLAHSFGRNYRTHSQVVQMGHHPSVLDFRTTRSDGLSSTDAVSVAWMAICDLQAKFEPQQGVANKSLIVEVKKALSSTNERKFYFYTNYDSSQSRTGI
ncbi:hypothetical protein TNIN_72231 [Trichonephila inaurata madagascariensis]|uniref:Uncharacterized protein n=1 Tax=Trichonephila inaurata madagascariensis TaxID=2747483 RepID=A0A8X6YYQ3_9ARAC|nr:hypothetical protein TNIN_72231 [Trichonephila inaurata madagascariensis]